MRRDTESVNLKSKPEWSRESNGFAERYEREKHWSLTSLEGLVMAVCGCLSGIMLSCVAEEYVTLQIFHSK